MDRVRARLPSPRTLGILVLVAALPGGLWLHARSRRLEVERRAAAVASAIAARPVAVRCPGPIRRRLFYEINEGSVRFAADGRPADETRLSARACDGLRTVLDQAPRLDFACLATGCPDAVQRAAEAVAVLTHEAVHLRGSMDEGRTECEARARVLDSARRLGLRAEAAARLQAWQATDWADRLPDRYRAC